MSLFGLRILHIGIFLPFFFYMLWGIEPKFCVCLCNDKSQLKFNFRPILSNFKRVLPLFWTWNITHRYSFPHIFRHTLKIKLCNLWLCSDDSQIKFMLCLFRQNLNELCPFLDLEFWFSALFSYASMYWVEIWFIALLSRDTQRVCI